MSIGKRWQLLPIFLGFWLLLQLIYIAGVDWSRAENQQAGVDTVANRVALDMSRLPLSGNAAYQVERGEIISRYIGTINQELQRQASPVLLIELGPPERIAANAEIIKILVTPGDKLALTFYAAPRNIADYTSLTCLLLALILTALCYSRLRPDVVAEITPEDQLLNPRLILDLQQRTLRHSSGGPAVVMANKPICFYAALLEFCSRDNETLLSQNKDMPEELQTLANKYFLRLVELGHTVRKRPNFKNSLDKTLSDIRAVLDEVYSEQPSLKGNYYPPKAHGEGSRSKLHHYGLRQISDQDYEILGR